ncbi:NADPH:quinone oxidoreductase family protein [Oceaniovalibus sp. ACAM 378]|uniref:NADPH:quinone oxidoreductase family protein n=1 Tax=Oceaniovalibus sp. ACAM 378 TaxID=2599923 RepID=UPI0011DA075E|nr:NADPH:quinone oxidoreductase family protein [Oceaniovalibus sp. ACAM 378]TYB87020.1 NADPH:quinone oxidoreductase family protein [Oceaniovalibus sp. ACAM 378]
MLAFQVESYDRPPVLRRVQAGPTGAGQVALDIAACGLNFADLLMAAGKYQERPALPMTLGMELAGTVCALGAGVDHLSTGQRVAVFAGQGGLAQKGVFDAARCVPLPDAMPFNHAAAFQVAYGTAHVALDHKARLQPKETLLVLGAAGGVGLAAVELGKLMGARVIACARGDEKLAVAKAAGADELVDSETRDLRGALRSLGGIDVVFDPVGGDLFRAAMRACNPEARIVIVGFASGDIPQVPANHLLVKNITLMGYYWGGYMRFRPKVLTDSLTRLFEWYAERRLHPHISHSLPLERAAEGLELLRTRVSTGKVIITMI